MVKFFLAAVKVSTDSMGQADSESRRLLKTVSYTHLDVYKRQVLGPGQVREIAYSVMKDDQIKEFEHEWELNFAIPLQGVGRFRSNVFKQRGEVSMVIRYIKGDIPQVEELGLPPLLRQVIMEKRGLIPVSYTHLDVYKRQASWWGGRAMDSGWRWSPAMPRCSPRPSKIASAPPWNSILADPSI